MKNVSITEMFLWKAITLFSILIGAAAFVAATVRPAEYRPISVVTSTRTVGTAYQPALYRYTIISGSPNISSALTITTGQTGYIYLQTSPDGVTYTTKQTEFSSNTGTLVIGVATSNGNGASLVTTVPPGYYYKFVTSGTGTFSTTVSVDETQF